MNLKTTFSAIVIDDEPRSRFGLIEIIKAFCQNEVVVVGYGGSLSEGRVLIQKHNPDLVFLDIELGAHSGFELIENTDEPQFQTIIVTAHSEYAVSAIKFSVLGYLMKPVLIDELKATIEKARKRLLKNSNCNVKKLTLSTLAGKLIVDASTISYCEADGSYTHIYFTSGDKQIISKPLRVFVEMLTPVGFFRVHNSYLINTANIVHYTKGENATVKLEVGAKLPIARNRRQAFEASLNS